MSHSVCEQCTDRAALTAKPQTPPWAGQDTPAIPCQFIFPEATCTPHAHPPPSPQLYFLIPRAHLCSSQPLTLLCSLIHPPTGSASRFGAESRVLGLVSVIPQCWGDCSFHSHSLHSTTSQMCSAQAVKAGNKLFLTFYSHLRAQPLTVVAVPTLEGGAISVLLPSEDLLEYAGCLLKDPTINSWVVYKQHRACTG